MRNTKGQYTINFSFVYCFSLVRRLTGTNERMIIEGKNFAAAKKIARRFGRITGVKELTPVRS